MGLMNNFIFASKRQRKLEAEKFKESIFHLGDAHRDLVESIISDIISEKKPKYNMVYQFSNLKSYYISHEMSFTDDYGSTEWVIKWYSKTLMFPLDKLMMLSFVQLDSDSKCYEEYPTIDDISDNTKYIKRLLGL